MKKKLITIFVIFSFICLNFIAFTSYCSAENNQSQEQLKNFTVKYGKEVKIRYDNSGRPIRIRNIKSAASDGKPEDIVLSFLSENSSFLDINVANLKFIKVIKTKHLNTAIFQQLYKDLPVRDKAVHVNLTKKGEIIFVKSNYYPHTDLNIVPQITTEAAAAIVKEDLGVEKLLQVIKKVTNRWEAQDEISTPVPELVIIPGKEKGKIHLAWKFHFNQKDTSYYWYYGIDAHTGKIIVKFDTTSSWYVEGNVDGDIYPTDGNDSTSSEELEWLEIDVERYNYGWIWAGGCITDEFGNYDISYSSYYLYHRIFTRTGNDDHFTIINDYYNSPAGITKGNYYPYIPDPTNFDLDYNPSTSYSDFDCVNVYYHLMNSEIYLYLDNWEYELPYLLVYTHYMENQDTAYYASVSPPYTPYICLGHGGTNLRNTAHARDLILHELQHAVTDDFYSTALNSTYFLAALNEAYSDFFSSYQTQDPNQGEWVFKDSSNMRHLDLYFDANDWDTGQDYHISSQVISSAFWELQEEYGFEGAEHLYLSLAQCPEDWEDLYTALHDDIAGWLPIDPDFVEDLLTERWGSLLD